MAHPKNQRNQQENCCKTTSRHARDQIKDNSASRKELRERFHAHCFVCGRQNEAGLQLQFDPEAPQGTAHATMRLGEDCQGYEGIAHGGIVSSVLDAAMAHCLFARDVVAMTAELTVRFKRAVPVLDEIEVSALLQRERPPLYELQASIHHRGILLARASGRFMAVAPDAG